MNRQTRSNNVASIVQVLAASPGGTDVDVISKKFPRFGPAESGTTYEESKRSFRTTEIPAALSVPFDAEEIRITLHGVLPRPDVKDEVLTTVRAALASPCIDAHWDMRARFSHETQGPGPYEVTVFFDPFVTAGSFA